jgi:hypothetical protein
MIASGGAILLAIPISISRTLLLAVAVVALTGMIAMIIGKRLSFKLIVEMALAALVLSAAARQSQVVADGMDAFMARWDQATVDNGGFQGAIVDRVLDGLFGSFQNVTLSGFGTGYSTNVGQKALTDELGFGASEGEWGRLLYDNGFILGFLTIGYRVALAFYVAFAAWRAWRKRSPASLLFASASFMILLDGQWGQATTLGSAIIGGGLALAAANAADESSNKREKARE